MLFKQILNRLNENNLIIIQGNTGCGKTTQVPQIILDQHAKLNKYCEYSFHTYKLMFIQVF